MAHYLSSQNVRAKVNHTFRRMYRSPWKLSFFHQKKTQFNECFHFQSSQLLSTSAARIKKERKYWLTAQSLKWLITLCRHYLLCLHIKKTAISNCHLNRVRINYQRRKMQLFVFNFAKANSWFLKIMLIYTSENANPWYSLLNVFHSILYFLYNHWAWPTYSSHHYHKPMVPPFHLQ